jgi:thiol:disulfide interchange protein DsbC
MKLATLRSVLMGWVLALTGMAASAEAVDKALEERLTRALESGNQGLEVGSIRAADMPGMYEVQLTNGPILYTNESGDYFIVGDLYAVTPDGYVNLAEQRRDAHRKEQLDKVATSDMIVFSPKEKPRAYVTVFTDVTCYYCQKLHQEVPELNRRGIEVRYLAYPRAGVGSEGFYKLETAWCSSNPQDTLTRLKNKESVPNATCDNPIASQFQLGQELGVRGTPAIITQDGRMIPGYQSATDLIATLGLQ